MDFQFWFYLIIAVIYILSRALKKNEPQGEAAKPRPTRQRVPQRNVEASTPSPDRPKTLTFEDLLKEIQESRQPKPVFTEPPKAEYVNYDDDIKEEAQDLEDVDYDYRKKDNIYQIYEDAKSQAFSRKSLEETMSIKDTETRFEKFKAFEQSKKKKVMEDYTKTLKDPAGLKRAVVMSEILNRKF